MNNFTLNITNQIPLILLIPTCKNITGVNKKIYPTIKEALDIKDEKGNSVNLFFGSFKTYGGTEKNVNGVYSIEDTANIETWYRQDIKANCRIALETGETYDILGEPEDINKRHQFLKFKVHRVKGGA
ncbi:MAG: head-tail adaptor protein [Clostridia bacterium]|nr:head-tail adaptor protein [Clostridia bacterium]